MDEIIKARESSWRWRSIQHYSWATGRNASWFADTYFEWIDRFFFATARREGDRVEMALAPISRTAIQLTRRTNENDRVVYEVTGGYLADAPRAGSFEFERIGDGLRVTLRDYRPSLPLIVYLLTQALAHALVMRLFGLHLRRTLRGA